MDSYRSTHHLPDLSRHVECAALEDYPDTTYDTQCTRWCPKGCDLCRLYRKSIACTNAVTKGPRSLHPRCCSQEHSCTGAGKADWNEAVRCATHCFWRCNSCGWSNGRVKTNRCTNPCGRILRRSSPAW
eukprot:1934834-Rhodomonas_salina.3